MHHRKPYKLGSLASLACCHPVGVILQARSGAQRPSVLNVNMNILEGSIAPGGIAGVRVDLPVQPPGQPAAFPQVSSYFFYQQDILVCSILAPIPCMLN